MQDADGEVNLAQPPTPGSIDEGIDEPAEEEPPAGKFETWGTPPPEPHMGAPIAPAEPSPQAGTGELPVDAPDAPPDDAPGGKGQWKGKGKGKGWSGEWNWKERPPSGPNLPRKRVSAAPIVGEVVEWRGKYGWIQPAERFDHPKAHMRSGRIFVSKTDLAYGLELRPGTVCHFYVFEDEAGLGAEECVPADQPEGAQPRPARPPPMSPQNRQGGFQKGPRAGGPGGPRGGQWGGKGPEGEGCKGGDGGKGGKEGGKGPDGGGGKGFPGGKGQRDGQWEGGKPDGGGRGGGKDRKGGGGKGGRGKDGDGGGDRKGKGGKGGKGDRKGGGGKGGSEFSLPGYVNLKQQGKGGKNMHHGLPDDPDLASLQSGMRGLHLGPREMHGKNHNDRGGGGGRGRSGCGGGWQGPPPADELPDAVGLAGYGDFGGGRAGFMGPPGPMSGSMALGGPGGGLALSQGLPGGLPPGPNIGPPPASHLPLPGGQGLSWPMQPAHGMEMPGEGYDHGRFMGPPGTMPAAAFPRMPMGGPGPLAGAPGSHLLPGDAGWPMQPGLGMDPRRMGGREWGGMP